MGYREVIMSQGPISFWPLDDNVSLGVAKEATGTGNDGSYSGSIFDGAIPLVSNGVFGTRLLSGSSTINYPLPGATYSNGQWADPYIWTSGKEKQQFSVETYFKLNETSNLINSHIIIFGDSVDITILNNSGYATLDDNYATYQDVLDNISTYQDILTESTVVRKNYGVFAYKNKIYFWPDPNTEYYVSYEVKDWNRRYHVVANYSEFGISLIVNGDTPVTKNASTLSSTFSFTLENGLLKAIGSDSQKVTIDSTAIYPYNFDQIRAADHCSLSRKTVLKDRYYNANGQVLYTPDNSECLIAYKFINNWTNFDFKNALVNTKNEITLRSVADATVSGGTYSYITADGHTGISLGANSYIDASYVAAMVEGGAAISMSFLHNPLNPEKALMSAFSSLTTQSFSAKINAYNEIVINVNGAETIVTPTILSSWNELLLENKSSGINVYLNGYNIFSTIDYLHSINNLYIGRVNDLYAESLIYWVAIKSRLNTNPISPHTLLGGDADFILKLNNNLRWSQTGVVTGSLYVPEANYAGSLAFYTSSSPNVSVTYNNGLQWPKMASMPSLLNDPTGQINQYDIKITLSTDDSEEDLPILANVGLYVYSEGMKRIISENHTQSATIYNQDNLIIYDDEVQMLDRLDLCGTRLSGNSYITIPSQSKNVDNLLLDGTKSISIIFKLNESLSSNNYILATGSKSLYWNGTTWAHPGFSKMYVNGKESFSNNALLDDWVHVVLISDSRINSGDNIYIGSNTAGANQTDITLGLFAMAVYELDAQDVESEYEIMVGYPQESLSTDNIGFSIIDYGLKAYNISWQRA